MKRRDLLGLFFTATVWPLAARAQQVERVRRIGILMNRAANNQEGQDRLAAVINGLRGLGWDLERDVKIETRYTEDDRNLSRKYAAELITFAPDIILASGTLNVTTLQNAGYASPVVFAAVADPIAAGIVDSLARPGGNATGFMIYEYNLSAKWLEILKQILPTVKRVGVVRNAANPAGIALFSGLESAAHSISAEAIPINTRSRDEVERLVADFARLPNSGLVVTTTASLYSDVIIAGAARHKLPAVYGQRYDVAAGGLISYGPDIVDQFRQAATYIDRILKGANPAELPVQAPTKFQLVINLRTAKGLGLSVPQALLASADEVIE
jgi:putative ABC transport system substrate-binding protein